VAIRYWKRMREEGRGADGVPRGSSNPWQPGAAPPTLRELAERDVPESTQGLDEDRTAAYSEWAARLHAKRQRTRDLQAEHHRRATAGDDDEATSVYWTTEALFAHAEQADHEDLHERPNPWRAPELLAVLDLTADASKGDVGRAYHRLAKQHHPDRYAEADPDVQRFHAERMQSINAAYRSLKLMERA
jgi:hypothetical protein